jgi:hypothetical protein
LLRAEPLRDQQQLCLGTHALRIEWHGKFAAGKNAACCSSKDS